MHSASAVARHALAGPFRAATRVFARRHTHTHTAAGIAQPKTVAVVGAPMSYGQPLAGTEKAPAALRGAGLRNAVTSLGWRWRDCGDVSVHTPSPTDPVSPTGGKHSFAVGRTNHEIAKKVQSAASDGCFVLTLGGDHSIAMGSIAGLLCVRPQVGIVWVDAHADINVPQTSPSGNIHGMPLSFLLRLFDAKQSPGCEWLVDPASPVPKLAPRDIVYVGLRDIDAGERRAIRSLGMKAFTMHEVDKFGIGRVMELAFEHLLTTAAAEAHTGQGSSRGAGAVLASVPGATVRPLRKPRERPLHLSYDIDAVDPSLAPSTGTTVPGGLNYREAHYVAEACAQTGLLGSMDLVEINPDLASGEGGMRTVQLGLELVSSALGKTILDVEDDDAPAASTPPSAFDATTKVAQ